MGMFGGGGRGSRGQGKRSGGGDSGARRFGSGQNDPGQRQQRDSGPRTKGGRGWHSGSPDKAEGKKGNKGRRGWFGFWRGQDADKDKKKGGDKAADWAREAVLRVVADPKAKPLVKMRTKIPWRPSSGKSQIIHPLGQNDFWNKHFCKRAFVLRRGATHRVIMQPSEAAALLRGATLGQDADIMGPHMWNPQAARQPAFAPESGMPAVAALARGKPVRLRSIEKRAKRIFLRDPLVPALSRLAPGRGIAANLHWTPPNARAVWENEARYEQIIIQVYGARKWTICTRGLPIPTLPENPGGRHARGGMKRTGDARTKAGPGFAGRNGQSADQPMTASKREGKCVSAILRRGDVLYLPSSTWHWTGEGIKASCHLEIGVVPLNGADLVMALGTRNMMSDLGHPALASLLPLWRYSKAEAAVEEVIPVCFDLPWADAPMDISSVCTPMTVRMALQRLSGSSARTLPHWHPVSGPTPTPPTRPWPRERHKGLFSPVMEALQPVAQIMGIIGVLCMILCFCSGMAKDDASKRRQGRSASAIYQDRAMKRKSRINLQQQTARRKKID